VRNLQIVYSSASISTILIRTPSMYVNWACFFSIMAVSNFSPDLYVFSMVVPFMRFLNLIVVLAAPRACFMMLKLTTLKGSPSISIVMPFLMSDVSTATLRDDDDAEREKVGRDWLRKAEERPIAARN